MFGIGDNHQHNNDDPAMLDNVKRLVDEQAATDSSSSDSSQSGTTTNSTSTNDDDNSSSDSQTAHAEPAQGFSSGPMPDPVDAAPETTPPPSEEKKSDPKPTPPQPTVVDESPTQSVNNSTEKTIEPIDSKNLARLKEEALGHLEPLVEHLGGTPEEIFKTTMMMIQANDNHKLIEKALEAARKIENDKVRAKAMLDIINEINYFSQNPKAN
jgi:hypothetical protein